MYRAERADEAFQRIVAIKVVRTGFDSAAILERFRRERETLAALDHPDIARLIDGGSTPQGEPYFVMEYVDDIKLGDVLGNRNFPNLGRAEEAAAWYVRALASLTGLGNRAPGDDRVGRFLGLTFERIGTLHEAAGRLASAAEAYQESCRRRDELARAVAFHTDVERDLAIAHEKLGNVHRLMGNGRNAEATIGARSAVSSACRGGSLERRRRAQPCHQ